MCENINIVSSLYQSSSTPFQSDKKQKYQSGREYSPNLVSDVNIKCTYIPGHTWPRQDFVFVETVPCYYITHTAITSGFLILKQISAWLSCYSFSFASYIVTIVTGRVLSYYSFSFALYIHSRCPVLWYWIHSIYPTRLPAMKTRKRFRWWPQKPDAMRRPAAVCAAANKQKEQTGIHPSIHPGESSSYIHSLIMRGKYNTSGRRTTQLAKLSIDWLIA